MATVAHKELSRIKTTADDGTEYDVVEVQRVTMRRDLNGKLVAMESPPQFKLEDGRDVRRVDAKTFEVWRTPMRLTVVG